MKGEYVLTPKDDDSAAKISVLAREGDSEAKLVLLDPEDRHTKVIMERYPLDLPIEAVRDHPHVVSAERLLAFPGRAPTRQVLVELLGAAPERLD